MVHYIENCMNDLNKLTSALKAVLRTTNEIQMLEDHLSIIFDVCKKIATSNSDDAVHLYDETLKLAEKVKMQLVMLVGRTENATAITTKPFMENTETLKSNIDRVRKRADMFEKVVEDVFKAREREISGKYQKIENLIEVANDLDNETRATAEDDLHQSSPDNL
ncbi:hypothetical protein ACOME3_005664 [Neoechinorhynchus agilis]